MKEYEKPEMELIDFEFSDIISTSGMLRDDGNIDVEEFNELEWGT